MSLTVLGTNSEKYQTQFPQHNYEPPVANSELVERVSKARFVAHNSPGFERGLHERLVMSLSVGTLVLTDEPFAKKVLQDGVVSVGAEKQFCSEQYDNCAEKAFELINAQHIWRNRWEPLLGNM